MEFLLEEICHVLQTDSVFRGRAFQEYGPEHLQVLPIEPHMWRFKTTEEGDLEVSREIENK